MMVAQKPKRREIGRTYREGNCLYLEAQAGVIRVMVLASHIIRVSFSECSIFGKRQGESYAQSENMECHDAECPIWVYAEQEDRIEVITGALKVRIMRASGSVQYYAADGELLLEERPYESKELEPVDVYKIVENENLVVTDVQTADGIKKRVAGADRVLDRRMVHTRLWLQFQEGEQLFGLGQAEEGVWNLRGTTQYLQQGNLKIAIPFLVSSRGYGILLSTQSPARFYDTQYGSGFYTEADEYLDYFFINGSDVDELIQGFRQITGKAAMLPKWAFGYIQSRERYETQQEIEQISRQFEDRKFGIDALVLDWMSWPDGMWGQKSYDRGRFPAPGQMVETLHGRGHHFMISIWPNMDEKTPNYWEMKEAGFILPGTSIYNAFDEGARQLYWEQVKRGIGQFGVDGWWCDSSEPITPEWSVKVKPLPEEQYHAYVEETSRVLPAGKGNAFGLYHAKGIWENQRRETMDKRVLNLTRSGLPGSQSLGTVLWSGDISASWETLQKQLVAGLQFCVSGMPYWTLDIGGFFLKKGDAWYWNGAYDNPAQDLGYWELYVRWFQLGAFLPMFRSHGTDMAREPWRFGDEKGIFYQALLQADRLRYTLMPYIYSLAGMTWLRDRTMLRMLLFDFPQDEKAISITDEFMFGEELLICPVLKPLYYTCGSKEIEGVKERAVYLPEGTSWYDFYTNQRYEGGQIIMVSAPLDRIPIFIKEGSILPVTEPAGNTQAQQGKKVRLLIYGGRDGAFDLYEDAGDGYAYEQGAYCITSIQYKEETGQVELMRTGDEGYASKDIEVEVVDKAL